MKILIAPDSFKDSLTAAEVTAQLSAGILKAMPDAEIVQLPLADGGEGSLEALIAATSGTYITKRVLDPLQRDVDAKYGILGNKETAVIELAQASGIELLGAKERNPWITTTYGTGQLIADALERGVNKIILCIGGSATNDGGAGIMQALGAQLLDENKEEISFGGGKLDKLYSIDLSEFDSRIAKTSFTVACDVTNPLCGEKGASAVYGPQKGAGEEMVKLLDANLSHYAKVIEDKLDKDIKDIPGSGAAGGTGAGLLAFCNAELQKGFDIIAKTIALEEHIADCDIVITGEGKIDEQTRYGKVPFGIAQIAQKYNKPVIAVGGSLGKDYEVLYETGINAILSITDKPMPLEEALSDAKRLLYNTGRQIAGLLAL